jgi:hypothetical protein
MTPRCPQTLDNGQRCSALAINGSKFCRHHNPERPLKPAREESRESEPLILPPLFDKPSILAALNEVVQALANGRIKHSVADTLLYGIKLAARLVTELDEAGLTIHPDDEQSIGRPRTPNRDAQAQSSNGPVALAASGDRSKATNTFNPSRPAGAPPLYPDHASSLDPSTARIIKELMAQTHHLASTQKGQELKAKS